MTPSMRMSAWRRYIYGWECYWRAFRQSRRKKHGAGKVTLIHAHRMGACFRYLADGQFRGSPGPSFIHIASRPDAPVER